MFGLHRIGDNTVIIFYTFLACFTALLLANGTYIFSWFLYADDLNHIPRYLSEGVLSLSGKPLFEWFIHLALISKSVAVLRLYFVAVISIIAVIIAYICYFKSRSLMLSISFGVLATIYPFSIDQGIFIIGSHPLIAALFAVLGLLAGYASMSSARTRDAVMLATGSTAAFLAAALSSPNAVLLILAPIGFVAVFTIERRWKLVVALVALMTVAVLLLMQLRGFGYHYSGGDQLDYSFSHILATLGQNLRRIATAGFGWRTPGILAAAFWLGIMSILLVLLWPSKTYRASRSTLVCAALHMVPPLLAAALFFGPSSIVVHQTARYAFGPGLLGLVAIFVFYAVLARPLVTRHPRRLSVVSIVTIFCLVLAVILRIGSAREHFEPTLRLTKLIATWTELEVDRWPTGSQVVLVLPNRDRSPSSGFGHWSSGLVGYLTGRSDIRALVGQEKTIHHPLFSDETGGERRRKMNGFDQRRPVWAYKVDENGLVKRADAIVHLATDGLAIQPFGQKIRWFAGAQSAESICGANSHDLLFWPIELPDNMRPISGHVSSHGEAIRLNEAEVLIDPPLHPRHWYNLALTFTPDSLEGHQPKTAAQNSQISVRQFGDRLRIGTPTVFRYSQIPSDGLRIDVAGLADCFGSIWAEGSYLAAFSGDFFQGGLRLGRGDLPEYWRGKVDLRLTISRPNNQPRPNDYLRGLPD